MTDLSQIQWNCYFTRSYGVGSAFIIRASLDNCHIREVVTDVEIIASRIQIGFFRAWQMQQQLMKALHHD